MIWKAESDMVADFSAWAAKHGWVVYAETASWDLLLVRPGDGFQIGVEAKLSLNAAVLCQVLSRSSFYDRGTGPDCRAVLVPRKTTVNGMQTIAKHLGIVVIEGSEAPTFDRRQGPFRFSPDLPTPKAGNIGSELRHDGWPELCPDQRHRLPDYVPDVTGGKSAPVALTDWKIKAIRIAILLERRGHVTRADFKALGIDPSRWTQGWLKSAGDGKWISHREPDFKGQHPVNYDQIAADINKWAPEAKAVTRKGALL